MARTTVRTYMCYDTYVSISITALRADLYRLVDQVIADGVPLEVDRRGRTVLISELPRSGSKFDALIHRADVIEGAADDLVELDWSGEWRES